MARMSYEDAVEQRLKAAREARESTPIREVPQPLPFYCDPVFWLFIGIVALCVVVVVDW